MSREPLTGAQLEEYDDRGFLIVEDVFSPDEIEEMKRAFEQLVERAKSIEETGMVDGSQFVVDGDALKRVVWCGSCESALSEYGRDRRLVSMAKQLLDVDEVQQLINQSHFKYPHDGVTFEWHQDSTHRRWGTELWSDVGMRGSFVETATAIDSMTPSNGPLRMIPGSHERGHIRVDASTEKLPEDAYDSSRAEVIELKPGSVVLFGPYVIHSSGPNRGSTPRRLFLNGFAHPRANRRDYPGEGSGRYV